MQSRRHLRRKQESDAPESHDRWLISYADFITLLFAFFVVMYAISSVNQSKYQQLSSALVEAFQPTTTPLITNPNATEFEQSHDTHANLNTNTIKQKSLIIAPIAHAKQLEKKQRAIDAKLLKLAESLQTSLATQIKNEKISLQNTPEGIRINMLDGILFAPGSAELQSTDALILLKSLVPILKVSALQLRIEGHTDNQPIRNIYFQSNWALSAMRANQILEAFSRDGIDERYLSAVSYGSSRPIESNETAQGRSQNRRVSILLVRPHAI